MTARFAPLALVLSACPGAFHFGTDAGCASSGCPTELVCSGPLDRCVECATAADCSGAFGRCDTSTGRCVECLATSDCDGGSVCEAAETHRCVATCVDDAGCSVGRCTALPLGMVCDACAVEDICEHMPTDRKCDAARRSCVRCAADGDCSEPVPKCDRLSGACRQCIDSRHCPAGAYCTRAGTCAAL